MASCRASTADVKPSPEANQAIVAGYEASCEALLATVAEAPDLNARVCYAHPWLDRSMPPGGTLFPADI